ncbi:MAG: NADH-quinone oxidoreductase subunit H [Planctomycetes bacterium]|nr:NADH-quinone oxidoreductase subunit H [Planctomycetota bacterium]
MTVESFLPSVLALVAAPLLPGVVNRTKAFFAGRRGPPLLQAYSDLWKLLRKGAVYSRTTSWVFRAGPVAGLAAAIVAVALVPLGPVPGALSFQGDLLLLAGLLALQRFLAVIAALDTGSAFGGMGASREVAFSALTEPALLLGLAAVARETGSLSLSEMLPAVSLASWALHGPALALVAAALLVVFLAENSRIPVDDPNTHLELTMIHEVMVLEHGGPDLAFILYGASLKLWTLGALLVGLLAPGGDPVAGGIVAFAGMVGLAGITGAIESAMARLRLLDVPRLLTGAGVLSVLGLLLVRR